MCTTGAIEAIQHLFFDCPFTKDCWDRIGFNWDGSLDLLDRLLQASNYHGIPFFTEAALMAAWEL